jgi:hypothetical protein
MKLALMMYGYYLLFWYTSWKNETFKEKLAEKDLVLVMRSKDKAVARTYRFNGGRVRSCCGDDPGAQCRLVWMSAKDGAEVMADIAKGNPKALMKAVIDGRLMLEGDASAVSWYMASVNMLGKMYIRKKKPARV